MKHFRRSLAAALLFSLLCTLLAGCAPKSNNPDSQPPHDIAEDISAAEQANASHSEVPEHSVPDIPPVPVNISTTGGVVLVGVIGTDDKGWYLTPEQPLNVEYTYFLDAPSLFEGLTRIHLFSPEVDGVDKALYLGQTVTIGGSLSFYRDYFDTLYLLPYTITLGKTAEVCHAAPDLIAPEIPQSQYDPSIPLPTRMEPTVENGRYKYNPSMLSIETLELMGNDFASFYLEFVDAFLNYESECPCPDKQYAEMLTTVLYYEFPLYNACAQPFEFFKHYDPEAETVSILYLNDREEHQRIIDDFTASANEFLADASPDQSEEQRARSLYHALCTRVTYDDSALTDFERKNAHYAYLNHSGVCITFANVYGQLLTQVGMESTVAQCDYTPTMGHVWSIITIDGVQYFCDPTFELSFEEGSAYRYFGLNYAERTANGLGAKGMTGGRYYTYPLTPDMLADSSIGS